VTRTRTAVLLGILSVASPAWAGPVSFGVKGGLTLATLHTDFLSAETRTGWAAGAFATFPLDHKFALQGEALYVSRGASLGESQIRDPSGQDLGTFETFLIRDDLDLGLRGKLGLGETAKLQPYLLLGPALSIETTEKLTTDPDLGSASADILENVAFGISFGLGSEMTLGRGHVLLEANYDLGITDLSEASVGPSIRASTWRFMTGYHF
jgi:outer membrane protein with beta-barrel domain